VSSARDVYKQGFSRFADGDLDGAIALYREAIQADDALAIAWNGLSMALARQGDLDGAIEAAHKLIELEPDDPLSYTNLSRFLQQKGDIPAAEAEMAKATQLEMKRQSGS
jgi:Flp pilus assembly protein TadD